MKIERTGVTVNAEDLKLARASRDDLRSTPLIVVHGVCLPDLAEKTHAERIDAMAVAYGLPKAPVLDGEVWHYGMTEAGEFTRAIPEVL